MCACFVLTAQVVYGYRMGVVHEQGTQVVESYHNVLKGPLLGGKQVCHRRVDWLIHTLLTYVSDFYCQKQVLKVVGTLLRA